MFVFVFYLIMIAYFADFFKGELRGVAKFRAIRAHAKNGLKKD